MIKYFSFLTIFVINLCFVGCEAATIEEAKIPESLSGSTASHMRFKIGFEFQEIGGLCPWALHDVTVQRKPLFGKFVPAKVEPLWHVVIDTNDIEFVTFPFTDEEGPFLEHCIETLSAAFEVLKSNLNENNIISFDDWTTKIDVTLFPDTYPLVHNKSIIRPINWEPKFAPQVTLQHPLEWAIPLYYGIFGFDCADMLNFSSSFPYRDSLLEALREGESKTAQDIFIEQGKKINGLVFLHALTLVQMTPLEEMEDHEALKETLDCLTKYCQVDAKMKLTLMSRRPFSSIYRDIEETMIIPYEAYFQESIIKFNNNFTAFAEVPKLFNLTNYGEQFLDPTTNSVRLLDKLLGESALFQKPFFSENVSLMTPLLTQGVVTTAMIRNAVGCETLFDSYFEVALNISAPDYTRFGLNVLERDAFIVREDGYAHDSLSPPWFLSLEDSMGKLKDTIQLEDKKYGEAIVEIRNIKNVGSWFLKRSGLKDISTKGRFLDNPSKVSVEALGLFSFLKSFTMEDFPDIYMGIGYALQKY